jgi:hypothetical protein
MSALRVQGRGKRQGNTQEQRIKSLARIVHRLGKSDEVKFHDFASGITTSAAGTMTFISGIAEGAGSAERNGVSIAPHSLTVRDGVIWPTVQAWYRCIIFQDQLTAGVVPAVTDVLAAAAWNASFNHLNETNKRFKILMDYTLEGVPATNNAIQSKRTSKLLNGTMKYIGNANTQASAGVGAIYALRITSAGATQPTSDLRLEFQFRG